MGHRGPQPVDIPLLKAYARYWTRQLFLLRDGQPGKLVRLRGSGNASTLIADVIPASQATAQRALPKLKKLRGKDGIVWLLPPVFPDREVWEQLKRATSIGEIHGFLLNLEKYIRKGRHLRPKYSGDDEGFLVRKRGAWTDTLWSKLLGAAHEGAEELLRAKDLPHYPRSERMTSDDKRIEYVAKVLAGLALGLAPLTATKRLSHWDPLKLEQAQPPKMQRGRVVHIAELTT